MSITYRTSSEAEAVINVKDAKVLDVTTRPEEWGLDIKPSTLLGMLNINMIHISPWKCCVGLMQGAASFLGKEP